MKLHRLVLVHDGLTFVLELKVTTEGDTLLVTVTRVIRVAALPLGMKGDGEETPFSKLLYAQ